MQPRTAKGLLGLGIAGGVLFGAVAEQPDGTLLTSALPLMVVGPILILAGAASLVRDRVVSALAGASKMTLRLQAGGWTFLVLAGSIAPWALGSAIGLARLTRTGCNQSNCGVPTFLLMTFAGITAVIMVVLGAVIMAFARWIRTTGDEQMPAGTLKLPRADTPASEG